jgi:hypothetical protein
MSIAETPSEAQATWLFFFYKNRIQHFKVLKKSEKKSM